jgi:hypothetical protein
LLICMAPCMIGIARFLKLQRKGSRRHRENLKKQPVELYLMRANLKQKNGRTHRNASWTGRNPMAPKIKGELVTAWRSQHFFFPQFCHSSSKDKIILIN